MCVCVCVCVCVRVCVRGGAGGARVCVYTYSVDSLVCMNVHKGGHQCLLRVCELVGLSRTGAYSRAAYPTCLRKQLKSCLLSLYSVPDNQLSSSCVPLISYCYLSNVHCIVILLM